LNQTIINVTVTPPAQEPVSVKADIGIGVPGPAGVAGPRAQPYIHTQSVPASIWTVNHGLGHPADIVIFNPEGSEVTGEVRQVSDTVSTIHFTKPQSGSARAN